MKTLKTLLIVALTLLCTSTAFAQTSLNTTTLTTAITDNLTTRITLGSTTGATANTTGMFVDGEFMIIRSVPSSTVVTVQRGWAGTGIGTGPLASTHAANSFVYIGALNAFTTVDPSGRCVAANQPYLPVINVKNGNVWNCVATTSGALWQAWNATPLEPSFPRTVVAGVAYTILPTDTAIAYSTNATSVATKSFTLPSHQGLAGKIIIIKDESGGLSATTSIVLVGTIDGTNSGTATVIQMKTAFQSVGLMAGSGGWFTLWCTGAGTATNALANCR